MPHEFGTRWNRRSFKNSAMVILEARFKSPSIPLFQRGKFRSRLYPLFRKEGKGEIWEAVAPELSVNFWYRTPKLRRKFCEIFL
jgi:hypothetical protein